MKRGSSERDAQKKLLLLEGQLQRLELMQARQSLRGALQARALAEGLPALLLAAIRQRGLAWLPTVLPWLLGAGKTRQRLRRGLLLMAAAAAAAWFSRRRTGEKNPGRSRDSSRA